MAELYIWLKLSVQLLAAIAAGWWLSEHFRPTPSVSLHDLAAFFHRVQALSEELDSNVGQHAEQIKQFRLKMAHAEAEIEAERRVATEQAVVTELRSWIDSLQDELEQATQRIHQQTQTLNTMVVEMEAALADRTGVKPEAPASSLIESASLATPDHMIEATSGRRFYEDHETRAAGNDSSPSAPEDSWRRTVATDPAEPPESAPLAGIRAFIATYRNGVFPSPEEFRAVQCFDISTGSISFLFPTPVRERDFVVALGQGDDAIYATAQVVRTTKTNIHAHPTYLIKCRFTGRIERRESAAIG
jgi:hypothetical protein